MLIRIKRTDSRRATLEPRVRALLGDRLRAYYAQPNTSRFLMVWPKLSRSWHKQRVRRIAKGSKAKRGSTFTSRAFSF